MNYSKSFAKFYKKKKHENNILQALKKTQKYFQLVALSDEKVKKRVKEIKLMKCIILLIHYNNDEIKLKMFQSVVKMTTTPSVFQNDAARGQIFRAWDS